MREIIFIGKFLPRNLLRTAKEDSKGKIGFSNHNFEMSIIHGLQVQSGVNLKVLSVPGVYSFPHNNVRAWIYAESYTEGRTLFSSIGYFNFSAINILCKICSTFFHLLKMVSTCKEKQIKIIVNIPTAEILFPLNLVKKISRKRIISTLIVPDIPAFVSSMDQINPIKDFLMGHLDKMSMNLASKCNSLVLLTEAMTDFFPKNKPYIVMEGIVDVETMDINEQYSSSVTKSILYTGTLRRIFGVMDLVNSFEIADIPDAELWICGSGDAESEIKERALRNDKIKFFGLVDSQEALRLQRTASVLVNPRTSVGEFTKYSFPSKTMEYLLSGQPVIAHRLSGIPSEYFKYILSPQDESVESLAKCLKHVLGMPELVRRKMGEEGRNFVINNKNSKIQMARVLEMMASTN